MDGVVGILFEYRIIISKSFSTFLEDHEVTFEINPLEPQEASSLVAELFGMDCDKLFLDFERRWSALKSSPTVINVRASIEAHEYVDRLERWEEV